MTQREQVKAHEAAWEVSRRYPLFHIKGMFRALGVRAGVWHLELES